MELYYEKLLNQAAIAAMQAIIPQQKGSYMICEAERKYSDCAKQAVKYAEALIDELMKHEER